MNKYISLSVCTFLVFFTSITYAQKRDNTGSFFITGQITAERGKKLILINLDDQKKEAHTKIKDNHFQLSTSTRDEPTIFALQLEGNDYPLLVVGQSGDTVEINGEANKFPIAEVSGNQQSREMQQYQKEFIPLLQRAQDINHSASLITSEKDTASISSLQAEAQALNSEMQSTSMAFVQYHPNALASLFVLMKGRKSIPPALLKQLYSTLSEDIKQSTYGKMAESLIHVSVATAIGAKAPDFMQKDTNGSPVSLSSFKGKYVLVDFWASWCGPCRAENPNVVAAYNQFKDKNFTILGVSLDQEKTRWLDAIQQDHLAWTQVSDLQGWNNTAARLYHVRSIPRNFLLDPSGKIIAENLRGEALKKELSSIFNK